MMFLVGVCTDFVLGFFLGKFLDVRRLCLRHNENQVKSGGGLKGVAPPARAAENMPKVSQEARKIIQKS